MSTQEIQELLSKVEIWKQANPTATEEKANKYFGSLIAEKASGRLSAQWSIGQWTDLGPYQGAVCNSNLINCGKTKVYKDQAESWALNRSGFSNGYNGGKIDAARHTYWNALMTRGINRTWAQDFSYAHEQDNVPSNDIGWNLRNMDLYNNDQGQNIGVIYPYTSYSDAQVESKVRDYMVYAKLRVANTTCLTLVVSNSSAAFTGWTCQ